MRILFLTQVLPYPLDAGPKVRAYYVLRHLAEQGHEVTLVSFVRGDDTPDHVAHLEGFCRTVHTVRMRRSKIKDARYLAQSLLTGQSFIIARDTDRAMHGLVSRLLAEDRYDAVHADQLWMAQYALNCSGVKRVLDAHNAAYLIPQRLARHERNPLKKLLLQREWRALARYEGDVCRRFDHVVTVTAEDRDLLTELRGAARRGAMNCAPTDVIPICVDPAEVPAVDTRPDSNRILILGTMFWPPNVEGALWFAREVFPLVRREVPGARLTIIGKNPPAELRRLGTEQRNDMEPQMNTDEHRWGTDRKRKESGFISVYQRLSAVGVHQRFHHSSDSGIDVLGYVDDPTPYLEESAVFVVPLHAGGGMRVKILDAWCWGIPIVSTTVGAEGIEGSDAENILIADDAAAFAQAVVRVMVDPALARQLRDNGRKWVEQRYNWRTVYHKWHEVYARLTD